MNDSSRVMQVCRLDFWINPVFDALIQANNQLALSVLPSQAEDERTLAGLTQAHAYHVSAAKDELPRSWFVNASLIDQCPNLLCISSGGAGFDTVDVAASHVRVLLW